ncbi:MAG: hypothetical protein HeimC3_14370 [Candidatus Heimdallarchaeota archaeon LC_3]|nr:MAG: hypothetical protein HeimC3_14370 [Candidatus Heimdallarchaeota archaeon LC_3]
MSSTKIEKWLKNEISVSRYKAIYHNNLQELH